jgi:hypothetical protein
MLATGIATSCNHTVAAAYLTVESREICIFGVFIGNMHSPPNLPLLPFPRSAGMKAEIQTYKRHTRSERLFQCKRMVFENLSGVAGGMGI